MKPLFMFDLKAMLRSSRRMAKKKYFLALSATQRANLYSTMEEAVNVLKGVQSRIRKSR